MICRILRNYLWAVLTVACSHPANAMDPERLVSQYVRDRWGSERGLQGEVYAITQTSDGYLGLAQKKVSSASMDGVSPCDGPGSEGSSTAQVLG
jgi:hypothetical protein